MSPLVTHRSYDSILYLHGSTWNTLTTKICGSSFYYTPPPFTLVIVVGAQVKEMGVHPLMLEITIEYLKLNLIYDG